MILSSCSSKCDTVCAAYNTCTVADRAAQISCNDYCSNVTNFEAKAQKIAGGTQDGCHALWQAHLDCWTSGSNLSNICKADSSGAYPCDATGAAYSECMTNYCQNRTVATYPDGTLAYDDTVACYGTPDTLADGGVDLSTISTGFIPF
jgi:hypothetical protein